MASETQLVKAYCAVLADAAERTFGRAERDGIGAVTHSFAETVRQLATHNSMLAGMLVQLSLYNSVVAGYMDALVTSSGARDIVDSLEIDEGTRCSLYLQLRSVALSRINGARGHMIERRLLIEAVPVFEELPAVVVDQIVRGLRDRHRRALMADGPAEAQEFFKAFIAALKQNSLEKAEAVVVEESRRLHERIEETMDNA